MFKYLKSFPRAGKQLLMGIVDILIILVGLWLSFSLRLGEAYYPQPQVITLFFVAPVIAIPAFIYFDLYRSVIRYMSFHALWAIAKAVSLYSLVWGTLVMLSGVGLEGVPRSVIIINWVVVTLLVSGSRMIAHGWYSGTFAMGNFGKLPNTRKNIAIYGAGPAGVQLATALSYSDEFKPVAFLDDNLYLKNHSVSGYKVIPISELDDLIEKYSIKEIFLAMPFVSRSRRNEIVKMLEPYPIKVRTLPGVVEIAQGHVKVDDIREVDLEDLLGREQVKPHEDLLYANILNKTVLVTGAAGSIGSELCRQIMKSKPECLILYERGEYDLYTIEKELLAYIKNTSTNVKLISVLGSVCDQKRMESVCRTLKVNTIYHAAAYKHVPLVEKNPTEAIHNNIFGTLYSAKAAINANVETFVLISTDKAVRPTNIMGATKRFAELILQGLSLQTNSSTRFTMVRFGNVLGSSGSVVPLFRDQIEKGGPVTVTDPDIIRYFMTIPEAAQLVIQAGAMGEGGDVFVLDMGEPVKIIDLAKSLIRLSGLEVIDDEHKDGDIEIQITGLRPGEKLYEELLIGDNVSATVHPLIMSAKEEVMDWETIDNYLTDLKIALDSYDQFMLRKILLSAISGYQPQCEIQDVIHDSEL